MQLPVNIGDRRELFWDEYLIDTAATSAGLKLHRLKSKEVVMEHDSPWEGDGCDYYNICADDDLYRMYYLAWNTESREMVVCYAQSSDGLKWEKPDLGLCEYNGSKKNNIILDKKTAKFDNFSVFKDPNPDCPDNERYKGVGIDGFEKFPDERYLWCFTSADGINFKKAWRMTDQGKFDSLNIAFWDKLEQKYMCYLRDFHDVKVSTDWNTGIRDIRWMTSKDFKDWTDPVRLDFGKGADIPLYTNVVQPYYRAGHVYIGFPSRYIERKEWTPNYDQLPGAERRKKRMEGHPRYGLAVTDCVFMSSRDGMTWNRWDEAFMRPGPEREYNWVYGDCYPALGMIETPGDTKYDPNELSMYVFENHMSKVPTKLRRYTIRIDGFVSYNSTYKPCRLMTRPFIFKGSELSVNFSTSAAGHINIKLVSEDSMIESYELFGDSTDRKVIFKNGDPASFAGRPVRMDMIMSDADIYSFKFTETR